MSDWISKFLVGGIVLISLSSIAVSGYKYFFEQDYVVQSVVDCNPLLERCFVAVCDSEEEECPSVPEENISYYKIFERSAKSLPACPFGDTCGEMICDVDEGCLEILCDEDISLEIGDECSDDPILLQVETGATEEGTEGTLEMVE